MLWRSIATFFVVSLHSLEFVIVTHAAERKTIGLNRSIAFLHANDRNCVVFTTLRKHPSFGHQINLTQCLNVSAKQFLMSIVFKIEFTRLARDSGREKSVAQRQKSNRKF